jgi:hypothetical protein
MTRCEQRSRLIQEKLLSHIDVYAAGPPPLISITCPETCVQRACDKKRSGTENVNDDQLRSDLIMRHRLNKGDFR